MDREKPFKTIEVIDSRTNQLCKVACMSCIRGHRTTSCGIPVCRTKIFWTVKRPGRPSNSCTCRYGATGGCKCVVAKSACPHKPKKGEKRSAECRCDEQGRYCCVIEPHHWEQLLSMKKPVIDFYPSREALDARFAVPTPTSLPMTPTYSYSTPGSVSGMFSPQQPFNGMQPISMGSPVFTELHSPRSPLVPRFGMMGIGAPQGSEAMRTPDVMQWEAHAPVAPRETLPPPRYQHSRQDEAGSCCQGPASPQSETTYPTYLPPSQDRHTAQEAQTSFNGATPTVSMASQGPVPQPTTPFDFNKLANDYFQYQLPSAICQTCGLSGCTCRSCPPVMQNFSNGSWAQCCGRKHARTANYVPPNTAAQFQQPTTTLASQHPSTLVSQPNPHDGSGFAAARASDCCQAPKRTYEPETRPPPSSEQSPSQSLPDFSEFDPGADFAIPGVTDNLDLSEFLMADLDRPGLQPEGGGCCAGSAED